MPSPRPSPHRAFTLLELLVVIGIIAILLVLVAPAFNPRKTADDLTNAAYTIKGVLEQARTYAKAHNTYTWVGFFEEDGSIASTNPATAGNGRVVLSIVASKNGSQGFKPNSSVSSTNFFDIGMVEQVGKLVKIDNLHVPIFPDGSGDGDTFDKRPIADTNNFTGSNDSKFGEINGPTNQSAPRTNSKFPFQYPIGNPTPPVQYTFQKTLQFGPRGENRINSTYDVRRTVEIGLISTKGNTVPHPDASGNYLGNVVAIQMSGFGSNLKIYRR